MSELTAADSIEARAALLQQVQGLPNLSIRSGVLGSQLTTFAIGGVIDQLFVADSEAAVRAVLMHAKQLGLTVKVLGAGSNLLIPDAGVQLPVLMLGPAFRGVDALGGGGFSVGGAASLMTLARSLSEEGMSGLEFAGGIPASVGGALFMNAGAHGADIGSRVTAITVVDGDGVMRRLQAEELAFSYRHSRLPPGAVVIRVELKLTPSDRVVTAALRAKNLAYRKDTQPLSSPSAGSIFRNPTPELPAGKVLELANVKGHQIGGAKVSHKHANWIVNEERQARADDVEQLIEYCQQRALETQQITLRPELVRW